MRVLKRWEAGEMGGKYISQSKKRLREEGKKRGESQECKRRGMGGLEPLSPLLLMWDYRKASRQC